MNEIKEPAVLVHLLDKMTFEDDVIDRGFYKVYLHVAAQWLAKGNVQLIQRFVNQADAVRWVNSEGLTLEKLGKEIGVSKAMLSQVIHSKKKLSWENLEEVLLAYARSDNGHGGKVEAVNG